jgi:hypothetical protein
MPRGCKAGAALEMMLEEHSNAEKNESSRDVSSWARIIFGEEVCSILLILFMSNRHFFS